jgi:hypothetical protein
MSIAAAQVEPEPAEFAALGSASGRQAREPADCLRITECPVLESRVLRHWQPTDL